MADLPDYYFRLRDNGAIVFRVNAANRQGRLEMDQIAVVNVRNDQIRPHGGRALTATDEAAIAAWLKERKALLQARRLDDAMRTVEHLNHTAQWAQSEATEAELDAATGALLLAMHDLRAVLVRKKADRSG